jgi:hypothetical protein
MIRLAAFLYFAVSLQAQPKFEDFPASKPFTGKPAQAKVLRQSDRLYRTKIRDAAAKGPNFAGHFTIAQWGCGAGCVESVIVDAANGAVFHLPAADLPCESAGQATCPIAVACYTGEPFEFKLSSQLLIVHGCKDNNPVTIRLRWTGARFERLP